MQSKLKLFYRYNALKARKQAGNEDIALSAPSHMLAAAQAGMFFNYS